jgi:hypothetical protein
MRAGALRCDTVQPCAVDGVEIGIEGGVLLAGLILKNESSVTLVAVDADISPFQLQGTASCRQLLA